MSISLLDLKWLKIVKHRRDTLKRHSVYIHVKLRFEYYVLKIRIGVAVMITVLDVANFFRTEAQ